MKTFLTIMLGLQVFIGGAPAQTQLWSHQLGTPESDIAVSKPAVDATGAVYFTGTTEGLLPNQTTNYSFDIFLRKLSRDGVELWTKQLYCGAEGTQEIGAEVTVDDVNGVVYLVGWGCDGSFLWKLTTNGDEIWRIPDIDGHVYAVTLV